MAGLDNDGENFGTVEIEEERLTENYTRIPNTILRHPSIPQGAKLAYGVLLSYAHTVNRCFPGQARMAHDMGCSPRSVVTYLQQLQDLKLVRVKRRGLGQTNVYVLAKWVEAGSAEFADQEMKPAANPEVQNLHTKTTSRKDKREKTGSRSLASIAHELAAKLGTPGEWDRLEKELEEKGATTRAVRKAVAALQPGETEADFWQLLG